MVFNNIIFIGLSSSQKALVNNLYNEISNDPSPGNFSFIESALELTEKPAIVELIVSNENQPNDNLEIIYEFGYPFHISWVAFIKEAQLIFTSSIQPLINTITLAYLKPMYQNIISGIFSLYGYKTQFANTKHEVIENLQKGTDYLLIDMDMNDSPSIDKTNVFKEIRYQYRGTKGLSVNILKDFEKGSLYDDICSPAREFCDILLSPEEYIVFLLRYLYSNELGTHKERNKLHQERWIDPVGKSDGYQKPLKNIFNGLKNKKKTYHRIMHLEENIFWYHNLNELSQIEFRFSLVQWLLKYIHEIEGNRERSTFTFASNIEKNSGR